MTFAFAALIAIACLGAAGALLMLRRRGRGSHAIRMAPTPLRKIKLDPLPPLALARLEISMLASNPDLIQHCMLGGPPTSEMIEENERREQEYHRRKLAIIKKYGVEDAFLEPLLIQRRRLERDSTEVHRQILELKALKEA